MKTLNALANNELPTQNVSARAQVWTVKRLILQPVLPRASFVRIEFAGRSGILESQVRPDRADRCSTGGDNHRSRPCILQEAPIGATERIGPRFYRPYRGFRIPCHQNPVVVTTGNSSTAPIGAFGRIQCALRQLYTTKFGERKQLVEESRLNPCFARSTHHSRRGLSLLEVVLALTILAVAAALLAQVTKQATDNGLMAQKLSTAQMLCESKMSEVLAGAIPLSSTSWTQITDSGRKGSWYYQIQTVTAQRPNMIGVRLSVTDAPESTTYNPELFFIVRWMIDPSLGLDTLPAADASTTSTGSTSSGTSSGGSASGAAGGFQ